MSDEIKVGDVVRFKKPEESSEQGWFDVLAVTYDEQHTGRWEGFAWLHGEPGLITKATDCLAKKQRHVRVELYRDGDLVFAGNRDCWGAAMAFVDNHRANCDRVEMYEQEEV
jgi:hypothetical protein